MVWDVLSVAFHSFLLYFSMDQLYRAAVYHAAAGSENLRAEGRAGDQPGLL